LRSVQDFRLVAADIEFDGLAGHSLGQVDLGHDPIEQSGAIGRTNLNSAEPGMMCGGAEATGFEPNLSTPE
jgi:hypothetical protein